MLNIPLVSSSSDGETEPVPLATRVPVLIVGGGPVGLSTALFLAHHGVQCLLVEQHASLLPHPRALPSIRTLEIFRAFGLESAIHAAGMVTSEDQPILVGNTAAEPLERRFAFPSGQFDRMKRLSPSPLARIPQPLLEKLLLEEARKHGARVHFETRLVDFEQTEGGVTATLSHRRTGHISRVEASYLVAADGAKSALRTKLGIELADYRVLGRLNTAFFRADLSSIVDPSSVFMCIVKNEHVYAALIPHGSCFWSCHIIDYPGKPPSALHEVSHERALELLRHVIGSASVDIELFSIQAWEAAAGLATRLSQGQAFLAGDAAHVMPTSGGLGMNTGIQDAHNLAWKLAMVLDGHAGSSILGTYDIERREAAKLAIDYSVRATHGIQRPSKDSGEVSAQVYEKSAEQYTRAMMLYSYSGGARVSRRAPHVWLEKNGDRISTLDLFGRKIVLLSARDGERWVSAARLVAAELRLEVPAFRVASNRSDDSLVDVEERFCDAYEIGPGDAVIVRPDGFLAWTSRESSEEPVTAIRRALSELLYR